MEGPELDDPTLPPLDAPLLDDPLPPPLDAPLLAPASPPLEPLLSLLVDVDALPELGSPAFALGVDEYRSAYQPPPFRMKFPPEIWRLAVLFSHLGQTSRGSAEIF